MPNLLESLKNSIIGGAVAENPAVMTASGWKYSNGKWIQQPDKGSRQLASDLATIGEAAITAPTLSTDIGLVLNGIRHPIKAAKTVSQAFQDMIWFFKNPKAVKVYHGTKAPDFTDLRQSIPYSKDNVGIHVAENPSIAQSFSNNGHILEGWIPKHNMETIDIGANDYRLLSNDYVYDALPYFGGYGNFHDAAGNPKFLINLLNKYGAKPTKIGQRLYTENRVTIPLQRETWLSMPQSARQEADKILKEGREIKIGWTPEQFTDRATRLNKQATELFSKNGKKVIKYNNTNPFEGGGGTSYMVTDPNIFHIPGRHSLDVGKLVKYPLIYDYEH